MIRELHFPTPIYILDIKDKYLNKAFNSFMAVRLEKSTLFSPGWMQANTYTNRLNIGRSIPVHWQNIKLTERFAAAGGVFGQEMFGDWGYLPGALVTAIGAPAVLNRNWYNRARGTRIGSVALAPTEFGKGFYSGLDSLIYAVSKNRPLTERAYNKIANRLRKEGVPEGEIEKTDTHVFTDASIKNTEFTVRRQCILALHILKAIKIDLSMVNYTDIAKLIHALSAKEIPADRDGNPIIDNSYIYKTLKKLRKKPDTLSEEDLIFIKKCIAPFDIESKNPVLKKMVKQLEINTM